MTKSGRCLRSGGSPPRDVWLQCGSLAGRHIHLLSEVDSAEIFRAEKSGVNEELVYKPEGTNLRFIPLLLFPGGNDLLANGGQANLRNFHFYKINLTSHEAADLGEVSGNWRDVEWSEPGNTVLFSRNVNGLTNIWSYSLQDRSLTQITFGAGPDFSPMPDPGGKGIYYVNGKSSGFLTAYHIHSKESTDIASENASQPVISPDGMRVMYIMLPSPKRYELWVSDIDGGNKVKLATGEDLGTDIGRRTIFTYLLYESGVGARAKVYIVGADGSGFVSSHGREISSTMRYGAPTRNRFT